MIKTKDTAIVVERPNIRVVDGGGCRKGIRLDVIAWSWGRESEAIHEEHGWLDKDVHGSTMMGVSRARQGYLAAKRTHSGNKNGCA